MWRLVYFRTDKHDYGKTGLVGGDYSRVCTGKRGLFPTFGYGSREAAKQAADQMNSRQSPFMFWPIEVEGKFPWNPIGR